MCGLGVFLAVAQKFSFLLTIWLKNMEKLINNIKNCCTHKMHFLPKKISIKSSQKIKGRKIEYSMKGLGKIHERISKNT